jgi:hypothetical protein
VIDCVVNLEEIETAHEKCQTNQNAGKIILKI